MGQSIPLFQAIPDSPGRPTVPLAFGLFVGVALEAPLAPGLPQLIEVLTSLPEAAQPLRGRLAGVFSHTAKWRVGLGRWVGSGRG